MQHTEAAQALQRLLAIMAQLRAPEGCPWDAEQTPESLKPYLLEECYETLEAIDSGDPNKVREELGDLLLQIVFQTRMYEERSAFSMSEVINGIADKLERRHPHVFGDSECRTPAEVSEQWETIKKREKQKAQQPSTLLGSIPTALPGLMHVTKLTERASRAGFDWPKVDSALAKVREEMTELEQALQENDRQATADELGDLLFATANLGRYLNIDAEDALRKTVSRFKERFTHIEDSLTRDGRTPQQATLEELRTLWDEAKVLTKT